FVRHGRSAALVDSGEKEHRRAFDKRTIVRIEFGMRQRLEPVGQTPRSAAILKGPVRFAIEIAHSTLHSEARPLESIMNPLPARKARGKGVPMSWWGWTIAGAILLGAELIFVNAQFYLVFVGSAAIVVGVVTAFGPGLEG